MLDSIKSLVQINLHHCMLASEALASRLTNNSEINKIALVQEPYVRGNKVLNVPKQYRCVTGVTSNDITGKPRAAIYVPRGAHIWALHEYSDRDVVTVSCRAQGDNPMKWIVSAYFDGEDNEIPPAMLKKVVRKCQEDNIQLVICCDANAHNIVWGSTDTNIKGERLFEYIVSENLHVCNRGDEPTFVTRARREVLDLTLTNQRAANVVTNWKVDTDVSSFSDHRTLCFSLKDSVTIDSKPYRPIKSTDWDKFHDLCNREFENIVFPIYWTIIDVENISAAVNSKLKTAIDIACPLRTPKVGNRSNWWSSELQKLRKKARRCHRLAVRHGNQCLWDDYREAQKVFKKATRLAKRKSWRNFCEQLHDSSAIARVIKTLGKDQHCVGDTLKLPDGSYTSTPENTLIYMLDTHYPNNTKQLTTVPPTLYGERIDDDDDVINQMITENKVHHALKSFKPFKSPGEDGIYPAMLQHGGTGLIKTLCNVFKACLKLGHIPKSWRQAKAIFLPKPGKASYALVKSFRPITLMSFILKTLERLILWYIQTETAFKPQPTQFAYRAGYSTEAALHQLLVRIEKAVYNKKMALGLFLDVEGAFSNVTSNSVISELRFNNNVHESVVRIIQFILQNLTVSAELAGTSMTVQLSKGCPQGGVLSPTLFTMVVDKLLRRLSGGPAYIQAYADDLVCVIQGFDANVIRDIAQQTLVSVSDWCSETGLRLSPAKTDAVMFTWKRKWSFSQPLNLDGTTIKLISQVKYLGITLDHKLSWLPECRNRAKKAKMILAQCRRIVGKTYGLGPLQMKWIYFAMVRPILSYASAIWASDAIHRTTAMLELVKVQRLALLCMTSAYPGTSTAALEAVLNIPPIDIFVAGEIAMSVHRLKGTGIWKTIPGEGTRAHPSHTSWAEQIFKQISILQFPSDTMNNIFSFEKNFAISIQSRENVIEDPIHFHNNSSPNTVHCYTDGSKNEVGLTGAGIVIPKLHDVCKHELMVPLGSLSTVFQAEVFAIQQAATLIIRSGIVNKCVCIHTDSQAAIKALDNPKIRSKTILSAVNIVNKLGEKNSVTLAWVPGHSGIPGNELADLFARCAVNTLCVGPEPFVPVSARVCRTNMLSWSAKQHQKRWNEMLGSQHARTTVPNISNKRARLVLRLNKRCIRQLFQVLTGHSELADHRFRIGKRNSPICPKCELENENVIHYIEKCPHYEMIRRRVFGHHQPTLSILAGSHRIVQLMEFISTTGRLDEHLVDDTVND